MLQHLGWVCQIIDLDVVEASGKAQLYYQRIRVNQIDIYEHDSESGVFLQIDSIWEKWLQVDKAASQEAKNQSRKLGPKHERFGTFVHEELGTAIEDTTRLVTLFEDDYWRSMARQYNGYTFGRQLFKTYHFTQAKGQCLDEVSVPAV